MNGIIQIRSLGSYGRVGNQLFQYAFARGYAEAIGAKLETPPWIGQYLFEDVHDPLPSLDLPTLSVDEHPEGHTNVNLHGYFQYGKCFDYYTLDKVREWYTFREDLIEKYYPANIDLAVHLRRGDYTTQYADTFCTVSLDSYRRAILEQGYNTDRLTVVSEINPTVTPIEGAEWLEDFFTLNAAKVLFRANSTFSWWAGTLGNHQAIYSPVVEGLRGPRNDVKFIKGNHPRCVDLPNVHDYNIKP